MRSFFSASLVAASIAAALGGCDSRRDEAVPPSAMKKALPSGTVAFRIPEMSEISDTVMRTSVTRGKAILEATRDSLPANVGNSLRCTSCHFAAGTVANAMPWVGVYSRFPQYRQRSGKVDLIEDRINDCFQRSMNGRALSPESGAMHDIVAYMAFLSLGVPAGARVDGQGVPKLASLAGDTIRGAAVFGAQCARCHGATGGGSDHAPPLWGRGSYNNGAGMSRIGVLAAFVHQLMPMDKPRTLTPQQAYDVAAYVNSRPRPDYPARAADWPVGGAPKDLGYPIAHGVKNRAAH